MTLAPPASLGRVPSTVLSPIPSQFYIMKLLPVAALAGAALSATPLALALGGDTLVDLALWGAGALSSTPKTHNLPGGPPEGGWSWVNCGQSSFSPLFLSVLA